MPVTVEFDQNTSQPTLFFNFEGDWTWHECREAMQYAEFLAEDMVGDLYFVYDLTPNRLPQRVYLPVMQKVLLVRLSRIPMKIVVVERGHFVETVRDMLRTTMPDTNLDNVFFTDTVARARSIIAS